LLTAKRTKVQIMVTKGSEILENHQLVITSSGACEGNSKGARFWGFVLRAGIEGKDFEIAICIHPLSIDGEPVCFQIKPFNSGDKYGFSS
jgi:hypothetical protein